MGADRRRDPPSPRRLNAAAVLDHDRCWVEVAGQVLSDTEAAAGGSTVVIRTSWGIHCSTGTAALGSFAARFSAPSDAIGREIVVEAGGVRHLLVVR